MDQTSTDVFFDLLKAGLWEKEVRLLQYGEIDFYEVYRLAKEQSVVGLLAAGLDRLTDVKVPQSIALTIAGEVLQFEQRNKAMNEFIAVLIEKMREADIYALLVKGQGIAQCYHKPLWRTSGDIDLFLSKDNYDKAKTFLLPIADNIDEESNETLHLAMTIKGWEVELHGTLRSLCLKKMDAATDLVQRDVFLCGNVRSWMNGTTQVFLPGANEDVLFVFTHILKHFFHGGIGLRQICDWCRLLWMYRDSLELRLLESRIQKAGILTEWMAFAAFAVDILGMPKEAMPLYSPEKKWKRKVKHINYVILKSGNFGHNITAKQESGTSLLNRKFSSFQRYFSDFNAQFRIFPMDAIRVWLWVMRVGTVSMLEKG